MAGHIVNEILGLNILWLLEHFKKLRLFRSNSICIRIVIEPSISGECLNSFAHVQPAKKNGRKRRQPDTYKHKFNDIVNMERPWQELVYSSVTQKGKESRFHYLRKLSEKII